MTENTPEAEAPEYPKDAPEAVAKGYALYDGQLQRYVSGVTKDKPKAKAGQRAIRV